MGGDADQRGAQARTGRAPAATTASADASLRRSFAILHIVGPACGLFICALLFGLDATADPVVPTLATGICLFWAFPLIMKWSPSLDGPAFASVQLLVLLSLFGAYHYGGLASPFAVWLIVAVLLGFLYAPKLIRWCIGVGAIQIAGFLALYQGLPPAPQRLLPDQAASLSLASVLAATLYISLIAAFYARIKIEGSALAAAARHHRESVWRLRGPLREAEAAHDRISEFMAGMSHELRTSLNVVIGYSELLAEDASDREQEESERLLRDITGSSRELLAMVDEVASLADRAPPFPPSETGEQADPAQRTSRPEPRSSADAWWLMPMMAGAKLLGWLAPVLTATALVLLFASWQLPAQPASIASYLAAIFLAATLAGMVGRKALGTATQVRSGHDDLTGMRNRAWFQAELDRRLGDRPQDAVALLIADLDGFKDVNDAHGHDTGDKLLREVAARLGAVTPDGVLLARLGGDEFGAVAFGGEAPATILCLAEAIVDALDAPFGTGADATSIGVSIGISDGQASSISSHELLRRSDVAMYRAKSDARHPVQLFDPQMDEALRFRRVMRQDLSAAIAGDQFDLVLQPVVKARTGEMASAEALLRWPHPVLGFISPAKLIAWAEESGQIIAIDDWVLERALTYAARLQTLPIAVNISPVQFRDPGFARKIVDRLAVHKVPANLLRLEITEGVLVTHTRTASRAVAELREAGIKIALDDFGTGFSSLSYLKDLPFDLLKVDRSFVVELDNGRQGAELLRAIVGVGHSLGMGVVAEGVETASQASVVQLLGCDFIQGYFTGKPADIGAIEARMSRPQPIDASGFLLEARAAS